MMETTSDRGEPRDRIMYATLELVGEEGLGAVTMTAIADRADVARQTLYNHFADVEQIVIAAIEELTQTGLVHLSGLLAATATTEAKLDLLARNAVAGTGHGHATADFRNALSSDARAHLDRHVMSFRALIESIIADGVADGSLDECLDPGVYAMLVEGLLTAAGDLAVEYDDPVAAGSVASDAILRVLGVGGGKHQRPN